ncbi:MAG: 7-cyano-7-deazaguanine synthase QueC [Desulfovibrio sp.]|nr:7-cyano-7-deazaguanine synthase QueC [Desulfovibrio sp.]
MGNALVLFSGGQDSTTCLLYAVTHYENVWTMGFSYGQRHTAEMVCRTDILAELRSHKDYQERLRADCVLTLPNFSAIDTNALTDPHQAIAEHNGLPTTFVPGRNILFLSYAAAYGYSRGIQTIVIGVGEADYSGYPDCRQATCQAMEQALSLGLDRPVRIETPLMTKSKAETFAYALELGGQWALDLIRKKTHTCYVNDRSHWHDFGYGCGECPSCRLRAKGWEEFCRSHVSECCKSKT